MSAIGWLTVIIGCAILEATTLDLVAIWFAFGGLVAMIASDFTTSLSTQIGFFIAGTALTLVFCRPLAKKFLFKKEKVRTNIDRIIGEIGVVTTEISPIQGEVKVCGKIWTAKNIEKENSILEGCEVEVIEIQGSKIIVKAI